MTLHGVLPASVHSPASAAGNLLHYLPGAGPGDAGGAGRRCSVRGCGHATISSLTTDPRCARRARDRHADGLRDRHCPRRVRNVGRAVLLDQNVALSGFQAFDFALPTSAIGDEVLIGTVTDSHGLVSTLQAAYKIADDFDVTAPAVRHPVAGQRGARDAARRPPRSPQRRLHRGDGHRHGVLVNGRRRRSAATPGQPLSLPPRLQPDPGGGAGPATSARQTWPT